MTPTPRTDAATVEVDVAFIGHDGLSSSPQRYVEVEFAQGLERELGELRELAEIGRLAVEHRRMLLDRNTTIRACGHAKVTMDDACDAYLAKEPKV